MTRWLVDPARIQGLVADHLSGVQWGTSRIQLADGNHRLAAALLRGDQSVAVEPAGFIDELAAALGGGVRTPVG